MSAEIELDRNSSAFHPLIMILTSMSVIHKTRIPCKITDGGLYLQSNNEINTILADIYFPLSSFSKFEVVLPDGYKSIEIALFSATSLYKAFLGDKSSIESLCLSYSSQEERLVWKIKQMKHELPHELDVRLFDFASLEKEFSFFDLSSRIDKNRFDVVAEMKSSELNDALGLVKNCHDRRSEQDVEVELKTDHNLWFITHSDFLNDAKIHVSYQAIKFEGLVKFYFKYTTCLFLHDFSNILPKCTFYFRQERDSPCVIYFDNGSENSPRFCVVVSAVVKDDYEDQNAEVEEDYEVHEEEEEVVSEQPQQPIEEPTKRRRKKARRE